MTVLRILIAVIALAAAIPPALAQRVTAIDSARSEVRFAGKQMGVPAEGRFGKMTAQVQFDAAKLASSRARIDVDLNSVDVGSAEVNTEVMRKPWFNVTLFPTATFESTAMRSKGAGRYEAEGKVTIKGQSRDVLVPFSVRQEGKDVVFEGAFTLLRLQFGVGDGAWKDTDTVANEVQVRFKLVGAATQ